MAAASSSSGTDRSWCERVSVTLFSTRKTFDTREQAQTRIEAYLNKGPEWAGYLFENHIAGQRVIQLFQRLSDAVQGKGVMVAGLTVDRDLNLVREFLLAHRISFPQYVDPEMGLANGVLRVVGFPETFVVAPDGRLAPRLVGEREWDNIDIFLRPGCVKSYSGRSRYPFFIKNGIWNTNCKKPPQATPMATARIGCFILAANTSTMTIMTMFINAGASAEGKKMRFVFNAPMARAARLINKRKGNIILVSRTVKENFSGIPINPGAIVVTIVGAKISLSNRLSQQK